MLDRHRRLGLGEICLLWLDRRDSNSHWLTSVQRLLIVCEPCCLLENTRKRTIESEIYKLLTTTLGRDSFLMLVNGLDICLLEGCDGAKSLTWSDIALSPSHSAFVIKCVFDDLTIVH